MTTPYAPAIWTEMRVWTVAPYPTGGFSVLCDGQPDNWFISFQRAMNEAQSRNRAEMLRLQRMRDRGEL